MENVYREENFKVAEITKSNYFSIGIDGTKDKEGRNLMHTIIFYEDGKKFSAHGSIVTHVNNQTLSKLLSDTVYTYGENWSKIDSIIYDNVTKKIA